jgi:hypothetical protein
MSELLQRVRRVRARGDEGVALVMVLGAGMVMTLLVVAVSGYALSGYVSAKTDSDWSASVAAAQAGLDDYVARLNESDGGEYWLKGADPANPAFTGWVPVPGSSNGAAFRYRVVSAVTDTQATGLVRIESSGRVAGEVRTVAATLKRGQFSDFVYFSDIETLDPQNEKGYERPDNYWDSRTDEVAQCGVKIWTGTRNSKCPIVSWGGNDVVDGRFHTNDQFYVSGTPTFLGPVTSGCPVRNPNHACKGKTIWVKGDATTPGPKFVVEPVGDTQYPLPPRSLPLRNDAVNGGCLFTGPTRIVLRDDGTMAVHSPNTPHEPTTPASEVNPCIRGLSADSAGAYLDARLPANGVIYVENLASATTPADISAPWVSLPSTLTPTTSGGKASSGRTGFPLASGDITPYNARYADVFIEGTLKGRLTVATENDIVITGNLLYKDGLTGTDVLGLVADNNVAVYHPIKYTIPPFVTDTLTPSQMRDLEIHAAILAVQHSFNVQNYYCCATRGKLTVRGSIAQKWRGAVARADGGTVVNNYVKDWKYDKRLTYLSPPKFFSPAESSWLQAEFAEVPTPADLR